MRHLPASPGSQVHHLVRSKTPSSARRSHGPPQRPFPLPFCYGLEALAPSFPAVYSPQGERAGTEVEKDNHRLKGAGTETRRESTQSKTRRPPRRHLSLRCRGLWVCLHAGHPTPNIPGPPKGWGMTTANHREEPSWTVSRSGRGLCIGEIRKGGQRGGPPGLGRDGWSGRDAAPRVGAPRAPEAGGGGGGQERHHEP